MEPSTRCARIAGINSQTLTSPGNTTEIYLMDDWETKAEEYLQDLKTGIDPLIAKLKTKRNSKRFSGYGGILLPPA
jgi:hypothetical protein